MFELSQEQTLLHSNDGSIILTTHRVIYKGETGRSQIMLEDFQSYEFKNAHIGNYTTLTLVFIILASLITISRVSSYFESKLFYDRAGVSFSEYMWMDWTIGPVLFFLGLSFLFYLGSRRYMLLLRGKYNNIEFRVRNPNGKSLGRFLERLQVECSRVKEEHLSENTLHNN